MIALAFLAIDGWVPFLSLVALGICCVFGIIVYVIYTKLFKKRRRKL